MNPIRHSFHYIRVLFSYLVYGLSSFVPKDPSLWVFVGWRRSSEREIFAENTKYFFLYTQHHLKNIRPIWIGMDSKICKILQNGGYEAYPINSLKGIYFSLRASHTFISGLLQLKNWKFSGNTKVIQLWHGKSLKKTGLNTPYTHDRYKWKFLHPNLYTHIHLFVAISDFFAPFITEDFHIPKEQILVSGLPKQDALIKNIRGYEIDMDTELHQLLLSLRSQETERIFFYGPTFRPDGTNPLLNLNLDLLNSKLTEINAKLVISLHPKFSTKDWMPSTFSLENIFFIQGDMDRYPCMRYFDVLITDYSSLAIDFLYMGKPVILYAFDIDKYDKDMGVYKEIWEAIPGPKVFNERDFLDSLHYDFNNQEFKNMLQESQKKLFTFHDTNSSKRIYEALFH